LLEIHPVPAFITYDEEAIEMFDWIDGARGRNMLNVPTGKATDRAINAGPYLENS